MKINLELLQGSLVADEGKVKVSKNKELLNKDNFSTNKPFKKIIPLGQGFIKILKRYMDDYKPISVSYIGNPKVLNKSK